MRPSSVRERSAPVEFWAFSARAPIIGEVAPGISEVSD